MPIPQLDAHGLLPAGEHDCTLTEIEASFTWNTHRRHLYRDFASCFEDELRARFTAPIFVDGSFVTNEEAPNDVDVVVDAMKALPDVRNQCLKFWHTHKQRLMSNHRVDLWLNLPGQEDMVAFFQGLKAQDARFAGLTQTHRKGILRIA